jgi:hypothetical protein
MIRFFPVPNLEELSEEYVWLKYYARALRPDATEADVLLPMIPQEHIDVLIYGAAAHALLINTDGEDTTRFSIAFNSKLNTMRRQNNRQPQQTIMRHVADVKNPVSQTRLPLTRSGQLENLL